MAKQYGLNFPKQIAGHKIGQVSLIKPSVFDNDSDTEDAPSRPTGISRGVKKQDVIRQEKAVADDPTVFQYDEVYDEIEKKRVASKLSQKDQDKKPKYIGRLLVTAEKRKRENERRVERQVQKEREEEGDMFKDKESFITPSYKKKLEELRKLEEEEKREEYLEAIGDVRKQGNLDGFYRHLYDQKINYEDKDEIKKDITEDEIKKDITEDEIKKEVEDEDTRETNDENNAHSNSEDVAAGTSKKVARKRKYRSRRNSENDSENGEEPEIKKEHLPSNIDADSDFSVDSSDSEEDDKQGKEDKKEISKDESKEDKIPEIQTSDTNKPDVIKTPEEIVKKEEVEIKPKKVKVDIWKKRTVGEKFDEAVKRYFERKALREVGPS